MHVIFTLRGTLRVSENGFYISLMLMVFMRFPVHPCCLEGVTDALFSEVLEFH